MYICDKCRRNSKPRKELHKVVVKTRPKEYKNTYKVRGRRKTKYSKGWEIVKELGVCRRCVKKISKEQK